MTQIWIDFLCWVKEKVNPCPHCDSCDNFRLVAMIAWTYNTHTPRDIVYRDTTTLAILLPLIFFLKVLRYRSWLRYNLERHRTTRNAVNKRPCLCVTKHYFSTSLAFTSFSKGGTYGMHQLSNYCVYMEMTQLVPLVCNISWACQTCTYTDKYLFTIVGYYKHLYI